MKLRIDHPLWRRWGPVLALKLVQGYLGTCRADVAATPEAYSLVREGNPTLFAMWHCHLLFPLYYAPSFFGHFHVNRQPVVVMASPSRDGELIANLARGLGLEACLGSRRKGGVQALKAMAAYFRQGYSGALIADGSRGPARVAQKGVVFLAREAQAPIIPLAVAAHPRITFNSWDRFELPAPFARVTMLAGDPMTVAPDCRGAALEGARRELEARLNHLFARSRAFSHR